MLGFSYRGRFVYHEMTFYRVRGFRILELSIENKFRVKHILYLLGLINHSTKILNLEIWELYCKYEIYLHFFHELYLNQDLRLCFLERFRRIIVSDFNLQNVIKKIEFSD